ncbi:MAG: hypothetical protein Q8P41_31730 [Pseudomonadota bacterium]|nr:hypothetical protein [Pseudomonadota bacterium]
MNDSALAIIEDAPFTAVAVRAQVQLIQEIMRDVMVEGEHYGTIPGCGDKKTLKQSGAEKLALAFRLAPSYRVEKENLGGGHREVTVYCDLKSISTGRVVGAGVGSCSTMESKYRYRNVADYEVTGDPIPPDSKERKKEYRRQGFGMKKVDDVWEWVKFTDVAKAENPDIADTWNTVLKMAKKRSLVDAVKSTTAASDIFTQDLEDDETGGDGAPPKPTVPMPQRASATNGAPAPSPSTPPAEPKRGPEEVVLVKDVREVEDAKGKKWGVDSEDGRTFITRDPKLSEDASVAKELEAPVRITYHAGPGGGFVLDSLAPEPDAAPKTTPAT